jgi:hypothetical protein
MHLFAPHVDEGADHDQFSRAQGESNLGFEASEAFEGGASQPAHQQGLEVIVCVVPGEYAFGSESRGLFSEHAVTGGAGACLEA